MPERYLTNLRANAKPWKKTAAAKMSRNKSFPEKILWSYLKNKQLGVNVHSQSVILGWIADFWIPKAAIVVEVDGEQHKKPKNASSDKHRDIAMKAKGICVMRFTAQEVIHNPQAVVAMIKDRIRRRME